MAVMFAELVREAGFDSVIISKNPRFRLLGYPSCASIEDSNAEAILLGGGAFFKRASENKSDLSTSLEPLLAYLDRHEVQLIAMSIGSDGVAHREELAAQRKQLILHASFRGGCVRLRRDLSLDISGTTYLPDIVLASQHFFRSKFSALQEAEDESFLDLFNFTRRSLPLIPTELGRMLGRSKANFYSHQAFFPGGGEIALPFMGSVRSENIGRALAALRACRSITSSKLHPGLAAVSMGATFRALAPRDKTRAALSEYIQEGILNLESRSSRAMTVTIAKDLRWQKALWQDYRDRIVSLLDRSR